MDSQTAGADMPQPGQTFPLEVQLLSAASYQATHRTSWGAELAIVFSLLLALHKENTMKKIGSSRLEEMRNLITG